MVKLVCRRRGEELMCPVVVVVCMLWQLSQDKDWSGKTAAGKRQMSHVARRTLEREGWLSRDEKVGRSEAGEDIGTQDAQVQLYRTADRKNVAVQELRVPTRSCLWAPHWHCRCWWC